MGPFDASPPLNGPGNAPMSYNYDPAGDMERQRQRIDRLLAAMRTNKGATTMAVNLNALNDRLNAMIAEMTRMQRALQTELDAINNPPMRQITEEEYARLTGATADADEAGKAAAKQSVAAGNTDLQTRAQAKADESKK